MNLDLDYMERNTKKWERACPFPLKITCVTLLYKDGLPP